MARRVGHLRVGEGVVQFLGQIRGIRWLLEKIVRKTGVGRTLGGRSRTRKGIVSHGQGLLEEVKMTLGLELKTKQ